VVIITGYGSSADEARAKAAGVTAFIHKPLTPEMIEASADEALRPANQPTTAEAPVAVEMPVAVEAPAPAAPAAPESTFKNVALFFAAPFIGLAYAVFLPFVGLGMAAWFGAKALASSPALRRAGTVAAGVGGFLLAPFIGLVYVVVLPFAGLVTLAWIAGRAVFGARESE
jgi:type IV secretory pathway VirB2 component (pilin)